MTCHPEWRCLRIGCPRCDLQRRRDAERKRVLREFVDAHNIARRFRDPTIEERRREREALRREGDPSVN